MDDGSHDGGSYDQVVGWSTSALHMAVKLLMSAQELLKFNLKLTG